MKRPPARVLCHGAMYDVKWNANKEPENVAADKASKWLNSAMPVAVGNTVLDALLSPVKTDMPGAEKKGTPGRYSVSTLKADIWRMHGLLLTRDDGADGQGPPQSSQLRPVHCTPDAAGDGKTSKHPPDETIARLAGLDQGQYTVDLTARTVVGVVEVRGLGGDRPGNIDEKTPGGHFATWRGMSRGGMRRISRAIAPCLSTISRTRTRCR